MAINLSNINISIRDFQAVSSGVINAGEVRLTSDHSIDKVNHHVGWFFSNNTSLSHAEVLAIKDAFVRALSQSGVDAGAIDGIRRQLGLAPMGEKDATLAQRSLKPLSRQEIREILDQHAREINQTVGEGTIRTRDEILARYTQQQRDSYAQTRNEKNAALATSRQVTFDRGIADAQSIISGDVNFRTAAERDRLIAVANLMKERILSRAPNGVPSEEPGATMRFTRPGDGLKVTFALGGSDAEVLKRLDDMLLALRCSAQSKAVDANPVRPDQPALTPTLSPADYKKAMQAGANGNDTLLTHEMKTMRDEVMAELRARFGAGIVPQNVNFSSFVFDSVFSDAFGDVENGAQRRTYAEMKSRLVAGASLEATRRCLVEALKPMVRAAGVQEFRVYGLVTALMQRHPEMRNRIAAASSPEDVAAAIGEFKTQIESGVRRQVSIEKYRAAAFNWYRETLANALHVPVSALAGKAINTDRLATTILRLEESISSGSNTADTDLQIEQAFRDHIAAAANERTSILAQIERLEVFGEARDRMIETVLMANKVCAIDLAALKDVVDAIPVNDLIVAVDTGTNDEVFTQMGIVARAASNAAKNAIGAQDGMPEELGPVGRMALVMALSKRPEVFGLVRNFFQRPDIQDFNHTQLFHATDVTDVKGNAVVFFEMFRHDETIAESNAALADKIGKADVPPVAARALYQALDSLGFDDLTMEEKTKLLAGYEGQRIAQQVRKSSQPVTHDQLQALVRMHFMQPAVRHAVVRRSAALARQNGINPADIAGFGVDVAFGRDASLHGKILAAITDAVKGGKNVTEAVDALIAPQDAAMLALLRSIDEIRRVEATAMETAVQGIFERTGVDVNILNTYLNIEALPIKGGSFSFLIDDIKKQLAKPETDVANWDVAAVRKRAEKSVQSFIGKKAGFIEAIYNLDISDSARGALLVDALEKRTYDDRDLPDAVKTVMEHEDVRRAFEFAKAVLVPGKVENMTDDELFTVLQDVCARLNDAIDEVLPEEKRINMDPEARLVIRDILNTVFIDFCGDTLLAAAARLAAAGRIESIDSAGAAINQRYSWEFMSASTGYNEQLQKVPVDHAAAEAANKKAVAATVGRRMLMAIANALNDEWLQADDASALRRHVATQEQKDRADAAVKRAPALLDRYSAGMDAGQRAALKAYLITLDLRDEALEASEAALRAKAEEIRPAAINLK